MKLRNAPVGQACWQYAIGEIILTPSPSTKMKMAALPAIVGRYASNGSKSTREMV
jgi:hypothetical protein